MDLKPLFVRHLKQSPLRWTLYAISTGTMIMTTMMMMVVVSAVACGGGRDAFVEAPTSAAITGAPAFAADGAAIAFVA